MDAHEARDHDVLGVVRERQRDVVSARVDTKPCNAQEGVPERVVTRVESGVVDQLGRVQHYLVVGALALDPEHLRGLLADLGEVVEDLLVVPV